MAENKILFTSESVSEGHPDKVCDQISDAVLDACLKQDKFSRVACETLASEQYLVISGEITTNAKIDYKEIAKQVINDIGYNKEEYGFSSDNIDFQIKVKKQSNDISMGIARFYAFLMLIPVVIGYFIMKLSVSKKEDPNEDYMYQ